MNYIKEIKVSKSNLYSLIDESWNDKEFTISGFGEIDDKNNFLPYLGFEQKCKRTLSHSLKKKL